MSKSASKASTAKEAPESPLAHGASDLPSVEVTSYNLELRDQQGFIGAHAKCGHAFARARP